MSTPLSRPRRAVKRRLAVLCVLLGSLILSGCDLDVYKLPLPGGADVGDSPMSVEIEFDDVLDLVPQSAVKVDDITVGKVTDISRDGYQAKVTIEIRGDVELPSDATAEIRQTSLLGEKFVSLAPPAAGATGGGELKSGDLIPLDRTGSNTEVEEVLGALSLVLNGGGVAQLKTITQEVNQVLTGREDTAKSVLDQIDTLTGELDANKGTIVTAIESLNRLSLTARGQIDSIDAALEELPSSLDSIDRQRGDLVKMLRALNDLSGVGTRVIRASKDATINSLTQLEPVLRNFADSGDAFVKSLNSFYAFPFVDESVGRDPQVARNLHIGDYTNLSATVQLDLTKLQLPGIPCTPLEDIPDLPALPPLSQLCEDGQSALNDCLAAITQADLNACLAAFGDKILKANICPELPQPLRNLCLALAPRTNTDSGRGTAKLPKLPKVPELKLPGLPGLGGLLGGGNGRVGFGDTSTTQSQTGGLTMGQLSETYDPGLVTLLAAPMAVSR